MKANQREKILYKDLSYKIQGCFYDIRRQYGPGQKESVYVNLLSECLTKKSVPFEREKAIKIYSMETGKVAGTYKPDIVVDDKVVIEAKSSRFSTQRDEKQLYYYLRNSKYELGYLVNFSAANLFVKRIVYSNNRIPFLSKLGLLVSCAFAFLFAWFSVSNAQGIVPSFSVTPEKFELSVERGDMIEDTVKVFNRSEVALPFEVRVANFTAEEGTGTIQFYSQTREVVEQGIDDTSFSPMKWITVRNPNFILDPGEDEKIDFSVQVPENAEPGGHYAVILFEPRLPSFYFEGENPRVIPQIGVLLLFTVEVEGVQRAQEPLAVSSFRIPAEERMRTIERAVSGVFHQARAEDALQIVDSSSFTFILGVKNSDIVHIRPEGTIALYNFFGQKVDQFEIHPLTVLPGKTREYHIAFDPLAGDDARILPDFISRNLYLGRYSAAVSIASPEGFRVRDVLTFWIFPWKFLLAVLLFAAGLFIMRKRLWGAIKVLARGRFTRNHTNKNPAPEQARYGAGTKLHK